MAAQNLMLAAHAHGLGSCCLTGPLAAHTELEELLNVGRKRALVCLIAVGYPAETPVAPPRKPIENVMRILA
jgi:nitroreductase